MKYQLTIFGGGGLKKFIPPKIFSVCFGGGSKTETGILHEILADMKSQISQQPLSLQGKSFLIDI